MNEVELCLAGDFSRITTAPTISVSNFQNPGPIRWHFSNLNVNITDSELIFQTMPLNETDPSPSQNRSGLKYPNYVQVELERKLHIVLVPGSIQIEATNSSMVIENSKK